MLADAPSLRHAAHLLTVDADWLTAQTDWLSRSVDALPAAGFRGEAADTAVARLHTLVRPMTLPPEQMLRVAQVLSMTAGLREELDAAARREMLKKLKDRGLVFSALCGDLGHGFGNKELNLIFRNDYDFPIRLEGHTNYDGALCWLIYRADME